MGRSLRVDMETVAFADGKRCSSGQNARFYAKNLIQTPRKGGSFFFRQTSDFSALARIFLPPPATASIATDSERRTSDNAYRAH